MKTFKQFLIEQSIPQIPGFEPVNPQGKPITPKKQDNEQTKSGEVKLGNYETTSMDALVRRLGSPQKALDYLLSIEQRRAEHKGEIDPNWVLPSVSLDDYNKKANVQIAPDGFNNIVAITPVVTRFSKKDPNQIIQEISPTPNNIDIKINSIARTDDPHAQNEIKRTLASISAELQPNSKYVSDKTTSDDVLWHELQHYLGKNNLIGRPQSIMTKGAGGTDYSKLNDRIIPSYSKYVTSNTELGPHISGSKMKFFDKTGILLGPNMTQDEFKKYKTYLNNDTEDQNSQILYQFFTDPNKSKQAEEFLRQLAKNTKIDSDTMMT